MLRGAVAARSCVMRALAAASSAPTKCPTETLRARLYYQSKKRGILENDILVGGFADKRLPTLSEAEMRNYDTIINGEHNEWDLYYFITGKKAAPKELAENAVFTQMVDYANTLRQQ